MKLSLFVATISIVGAGGFVLQPHRAAPTMTYVVALKSTTYAPQGATSYDEVLARLHDDYKHLQDELLVDMNTKYDDVAAEEVAERMMQNAVDTAAVQKYKLVEAVSKAQKDLLNAHDDLTRVVATERQEHGIQMSAQHEAHFLESIDDAYEDLERLRDMSVMHASHHVEEDFKDIELESSFQELEAEDRMSRATETIEMLEHNLQELKSSLAEMQKVKHDKRMKEWHDAQNRPWNSANNMAHWKYQLEK